MNESRKPRRIAHLDMDSFYVSVERVLDPSLCNKPVIVGGSSDRGVVSSASYEARKFGIHSAMPIRHAQKLCPHAILVSVRGRQYSRASKAVYAILENYAPLIEAMSIDEWYMDLTGTERLMGPATEVALSIQKKIKDKLRLPCSMGISSSKLVSKIASDQAKPEGIIEVPQGRESAFLAPLPIKVMPGIGSRTRERLSQRGIKTLGDIQNIKPEFLENNLGRHGQDLYHRAQGHDTRPVIAEREAPKSIGHETTFSKDTNDMQFLRREIFKLTEKTAARLRAKELAAARITLKIRYSDFDTHTHAAMLKEPSNLNDLIFQTAERILLKNLQQARLVRLVGLSASSLTNSGWQLSLFEQKNRRKMEKLYKSIDRIRNRYGFEIISTGPVDEGDS